MIPEQHGVRQKEGQAVGILSTESNSSSSVWMTHWTKTSYTTDPLYGSSRYDLNVSNNVSYVEHGNPQFKLTETRVDVHSVVGTTGYRKTSAKNAGVGQMPGSVNGVGDKIIVNSGVYGAADLSVSKTATTNGSSVRGSFDLNHLPVSANQIFESCRFPMYNINRTIDSIMRQKMRPLLYNKVCVPEQHVKSHLAKSRLMTISSSEYMYRSQSCDRKRREGVEPAVYWMIGQGSPINSCSCSNADSGSPGSQPLLEEQTDFTKADSMEHKTGVAHKVSNTIKNPLRIQESHSEGENSVFRTSVPCKKRDRYLFEMLTLTSGSCDIEDKNTNKHGVGNATYMSLAQSMPSSKKFRTDEAPRNPGGSWSFSYEACAGSASKQAAEGCIEDNLPHQRMEVTSSYGRDASKKPVTSMDVDSIFTDTIKAKDAGGDASNDEGLDLEASSRWLDRLKHPMRIPHANPHVLSAKKVEGIEGPLAGEVSSLFNSVFKSTLARDEVPSPVLPKNAHSWVRRWCCNDNSQVPTTEEGLNSDEVPAAQAPPPDYGSFPSIAAMAMMGKAMSKFRPCEFQRRGPSLVWNT